VTLRQLADAALPVAIAAALAALLLWALGSEAATPQAPAASSPLDESGVLDRVAAAWPDIADAADAHDLDPLALAALLVVESRALPVVGGWRDRMWGAGQVHAAVWLPLLVEAGVVDGRDDLLRQREGIHAAAWVWRHILEQWGPGTRWNRGGACVLCLYQQGHRALGLRDGCDYSRTVLAVRAGLLARLAGHDRVAVTDGGGR
jgi:hypothetical protein